MDASIPGSGPAGHSGVPGAGAKLADRYRLEVTLARRGGATTWRGFDEALARAVLVHVLDPYSPTTPDVLAAARRAAVATDSRFLRVLDAMNDRRPFVVCEYVTGVSLAELLSHGPITGVEAAYIVHEIADALAPMHAQGIFHRRINPDNIMITPSGNIKITGFLIEAALTESSPEPTPDWRVQEAEDVHGMGKLLYACMVTRWPIDLDQSQTSRFGLIAAPTTSPAVSPHPVWVSPSSLSSQVPSGLDALTMRILAPKQGQRAITTADEIVKILGKVLGNAEGEGKLEQRVRALQSSEEQNTVAAPVLGTLGSAPGSASTSRNLHTDRPDISDDNAGSTHRLPPVRDDGPPPVRPTDRTLTNQPVVGSTHANPPASARPPKPMPNTRTPLAGREGSQPWPPAQQDSLPLQVGAVVEHDDLPLRQENEDDEEFTGELLAHSKELPPRAYRLARWMIPLFVAIMIIVAVSGMLRSCDNPSASRGSSSSSSSAGQTQAREAALAGAPVSVVEFDPVADGGEAAEMPAEVGYATDGDVTTAWHTQQYWNTATFGNLKPGSGLMLNFGEESLVNAVSLTLEGSPTGVQIMVPKNDDDPSQETVNDWTTVASNSAAGTEVTLTPDHPVTTRYLLVYLTSLPQVSDGRYQAGIAEIDVNP